MCNDDSDSLDMYSLILKPLSYIIGNFSPDAKLVHVVVYLRGSKAVIIPEEYRALLPTTFDWDRAGFVAR